MSWKAEGETPDERTYQREAAMLREYGRGWIKVSCNAFAHGMGRADLPPPTRWLWTVLVRWCGWECLWLMSLVCVAFSATSLFACDGFPPWWSNAIVVLAPLLSWADSRKLQDAPVAALTLAAIALAWHGHSWSAAVACAALLCVKEGGLLMLPAVALAGYLGTGAVPWPLLIAPLLWLSNSLAACGPSLFPALLRSVRGQRHEYTLAHQSGMPHRLVVDLAMVSPWVLLSVPLAATYDWRLPLVGALIVMAHAVAPVRNVRTVLAADLVFRVCVGSLLCRFHYGWCALPPLLAWDVWLGTRLRGLRDTVTAALGQAMGVMP